MLQALRLTKAYFEQVFIAADQLVNALIPPLDGTISYADETLSARAHRMRVKGHRYWGWTAGAIDKLFFWQRGHCHAAYQREHERKDLPHEYRAGVPIFESRGSAR